MGNTSFTQLDVWKKAFAVVRDLYRLAERWPREERFRLTDQLLRAALSVPANIAEGFGRRAPRDKAHFYTIASGSTEELKCLILLALELGMLPPQSDFFVRTEDVSRMLRRLTEATLAPRS